jgi:hypothetical protein
LRAVGSGCLPTRRFQPLHAPVRRGCFGTFLDTDIIGTSVDSSALDRFAPLSERLSHTVFRYVSFIRLELLPPRAPRGDPKSADPLRLSTGRATISTRTLTSPVILPLEARFPVSSPVGSTRDPATAGPESLLIHHGLGGEPVTTRDAFRRSRSRLPRSMELRSTFRIPNLQRHTLSSSPATRLSR